jgi:hypothetical protein
MVVGLQYAYLQYAYVVLFLGSNQYRGVGAGDGALLRGGELFARNTAEATNTRRSWPSAIP